MLDLVGQVDSVFNSIDINMEGSFALLKAKHDAELNQHLNKEFPDFQLESFTRDTLSSIDLKGKPSILFFWDLYCQPCLDQMSLLNALKERYDAKMNFISITRHSRSEVKKFLAQDKLDFLHLINKGEATKLEVVMTPIPRIYILDRNNVVRKAMGLPELRECCLSNEKEKGLIYFEKIISSLL